MRGNEKEKASRVPGEMRQATFITTPLRTLGRASLHSSYFMPTVNQRSSRKMRAKRCNGGDEVVAPTTDHLNEEREREKKKSYGRRRFKKHQ